MWIDKLEQFLKHMTLYLCAWCVGCAGVLLLRWLGVW